MSDLEKVEAGHGGPRFDGAAIIRRPRRSLERRLGRWMLLFIALPVVFCMALFGTFIHRQIIDHHSGEGELLAAVMASALAEALSDGWDGADARLIERLSVRPRVAFVSITDRSGMPVHISVFDPEAWAAVSRDEHGRNRNWPLSFDEPTLIQGGNAPIIVRSADVIAATPDNGSPSATGEQRPDPDAAESRKLGTVLFGLKVDGVRDQIVRYQLTQLAGVLVAILISLALMRWYLRQWTQPLRELVGATFRLAEGRPPDPVTYRTDDELGYLAGAFNDMAARTIASRRALIEANQRLESRVEERTAQIHKAVEQLNEAATTDWLTGIANRRAFEAALDDHFDIARRDGLDLTCALIDLDGFKPINDLLGHKMGDRLLAMLGGLLKEVCRAPNIPARLGGDEFAVLFVRTGPSEARRVCAELMERFEKEQFRLLSAHEAPVKASMSIGLAGLRQMGATDQEDFIRKADAALYEAKRQGKARVCMAEGSHQATPHADRSPTG